MILSKCLMLTSFTRKFHTTKMKLTDRTGDPRPAMIELADEPHILLFAPTMWVLGILILPISLYAWNHEYQEKFVKKQRMPFPPYDCLHQRTKKYPWGDGEHTPMHHPTFNFTPKGYETDKDGNPLPKGVYALE